MKKIQMSRFINTELKSDSETESKSDNELMTKLKSGSDSEESFYFRSSSVIIILSKSKHILVHKIFIFS